MNTETHSTDYRAEEYRQVRDEITTLDKNVNNLFVVSVVVSVSLLSALAAILPKLSSTRWYPDGPVWPYAFLAPCLIVCSFFWVMIGQRRNLHRAATYLQVFFEPEKDLYWETRVSRFRWEMRGESFDPFPVTYWVIWLCCSTMFLLGQYLVHGEFWTLHMAVPFLLAIALWIETASFTNRSSMSVRIRCLREWNRIKADAQPEN